MNYSKVSSKDQAVISPRSILKISPWIIQRSISIKLLILILFLNFVRYIYIYILYGLIYSFFFIPPKVYTWLPPISVRRPYFPYTTFAEKYPYETGVILLRPTFDREHERVRVTFWGVGELQVTVYRYLERSDFIFTIIDYDYRSFFFRDKHEFDKFDLVEWMYIFLMEKVNIVEMLLFLAWHLCYSEQRKT